MLIEYSTLAFIIAGAFFAGIAFILLFQRFFRIELKEPRYLKFYMPNGMRDGYLELPLGMASNMMPVFPSIPKMPEKPKADGPEMKGHGSYL